MNSAKIFKTGQLISISLLVALTPLTYWPMQNWLNLPVYELSFGLCVSLFLVNLIFPKLNLPQLAVRDGILLLFFLWLGYNALTIGVSGAAAPLLQMAVLLFVLAHTDFSTKQVELIVVSMLVGGTALALTGIYQHLYEPWHRLIPATLGNANLVSGFLTLLIPLSFSFWLHEGKNYRVFGVITTTILTLAMAFTYTRAGWLTAFVAMVGFALTKNKKLLIFVVLYLLIFGLTVQGVGSRLAQFSQAKAFLPVAQNQTKQANEVNSVQSRVNLWRFALHDFSRYPLTGIGIGNYRTRLTAYMQQNSGAAKKFLFGAEDVHNAYLDILVEAGLPGLLLLLGVLLLWLVPGACEILTQRGSPLQLGLLWGMLAYLAHNFTNILLLWVPTSCDFWVALALLSVLRLEIKSGGVLS